MRRTNPKRRGISSVIAVVFVFLIMSSALGVTMWTMEQQNSVTAELLEETRSKLGELNEDIDITEVGIVDDKFSITLSNNGGIAAHVRSIYIVNETASPEEQYRFDVDYLVDGRSVFTDAGEELPIVASNTTAYSIKVVTDSGSTATAEFLPMSLTPLPMNLYVIPPTVTTGEEVTILYSITNNMSSTAPLTISPNISSSISCSGACSLTKLSAASDSVVIHEGSTTLIKEVYQANGPPGTTLTFNASYAGALHGNYVIEQGSIIVVEIAQSVVTSIAMAPDIYLMLPGPFGTVDQFSNDKGLWGAVVVNPTNSTMEVSRVLITAFTGAHDGATQIVAGDCHDNNQMTPITPGDANEWTCPHDNQIMWADLTTPETLAANETRTFLVRVKPTGLPAGDEEPGATVTATVYTDIGVFSKAGYTVGMTDINQPLGNVYLTNSNDTSDALIDANMLGHLNSISPGTNTTFYVAIADLDTDPNTYIVDGARLIINVPPGFNNVTVVDQEGFVENATISVRADGITQIIGTTMDDLGDDSSGEAVVLAFAAITPSPATPTTYLMFTFIDGITNSSPPFSAGAIAETALQVNDAS